MRRLFFVVIASVAASLVSVSGAFAQVGTDGGDLSAFQAGDPGDAADLDLLLLVQVQVAAQAGDEAAIATLAENNPTLAASIAREAAKANPGKAADFAKAVVAKVPSARAAVQREVIAAVPSAKAAIEAKVAEVPTTPTTGGDEEVVTGSIPDNNNDDNNDPIVIATGNTTENALQDTGEGSPQQNP